MPQFNEETLQKMTVKRNSEKAASLSDICEKYNIRKGNLYFFIKENHFFKIII